jgi:hypothetical protein|nr:MAG TPA: hypothetical protein [Caudoviricetes sp.]
MAIVTEYMTKNPCYQSGRTITVKGLMLHSVGCAQPNPRVFVKNWNSASYDRACVHGFIGEDEAIITLPCLETAGKAMRAWHCGASGNNTHIGVEMCEPGNIKYTGGASFTCADLTTARSFVRKTTEQAVELFAQLCKFHGLNPMQDIVSHAEGHALGIASNHADPDHLWRGLGMDYNMDDFRRDVAERLGELKEDEDVVRYKRLNDIPNENGFRDIIEQLMDAGILGGDGSDKTGNNDVIDLSHDMVRNLVLEYRGGAFDRKFKAVGMEPVVKD